MGDWTEVYAEFARKVGRALTKRKAIGRVDALARAKDIKELEKALYEILRETYAFVDPNDKDAHIFGIIKSDVEKVLSTFDENALKEGRNYDLASRILAEMIDSENYSKRK